MVADDGKPGSDRIELTRGLIPQCGNKTLLTIVVTNSL
jgi:hypothetical protein